jgi:hypothetical protein
MKGDISANHFRPEMHYLRVLMQQGRVQLDSDWNEQAAILFRYVETLAADLIGPFGGAHYVVKPDTAGGTRKCVWFRLTRDRSAPE